MARTVAPGVPDIALGGDGGTRLADVLIGRMLLGGGPETPRRT